MGNLHTESIFISFVDSGMILGDGNQNLSNKVCLSWIIMEYNSVSYYPFMTFLMQLLSVIAQPLDIKADSVNIKTICFKLYFF